MNSTPSPDRESKPGQGPLVSVIILVLVGTVVLLGLGAVSFFYLGPVTIVVWIFAFTVFHYVTWGWWLSGVIRSSVDAEENQ